MCLFSPSKGVCLTLPVALRFVAHSVTLIGAESERERKCPFWRFSFLSSKARDKGISGAAPERVSQGPSADWGSRMQNFSFLFNPRSAPICMRGGRRPSPNFWPRTLSRFRCETRNKISGLGKKNREQCKRLWKEKKERFNRNVFSFPFFLF